MLDNFSCATQKVMAEAESIAFEFHHPSIGSEHLLLALLKNEDNIINNEFSLKNIKYKVFSDKIRRLYSKEKVNNIYLQYSLELKEIVEEANKIASKTKEGLITIDHICIAMLSFNNTATDLMKENGIDCEFLIKQIVAQRKRKSELSTITDLHLLGVNNKDPLIGRENEISELINSLSRRNKPNAILIGEPGVGKTAIVEELARRLLNNEISRLNNKVIYELDLASTVSGTKYRGEFEEKIKKIIRKVREDGNAILFIDEIHNIVKAGGAEGAIDASNIFKPYLARGEIQVIGATTLEEFNESFEKDKALKRRFQIINVEESSLNDTLHIMIKTKNLYEQYYGINISNDIVKLICALANRYLLNQHFPDKAIDLLDNSCVNCHGSELKEKDVYFTLELFYKIEMNNEKRIADFFADFDKNIFGQNNVKNALNNNLENNKCNVYLFYGPNGVGKATTAELISKDLYNNQFLAIKCELYNDFVGINKLINAGNQYTGESASPLVRQLKKYPNTVILFEDIDKAGKELLYFAHTSIKNGYFYDSKGNKVLVSNAIFIMTSSYGYEEKLDFSYTKFEKLENDSLIKEKIKNKIGCDLFSNFESIINFSYLDSYSIKEIIKLRIKGLDKISINEIDELLDEKIAQKTSELHNDGGNTAILIAKEIIEEITREKTKIN